MFQRFTDRARRVVVLAQEEARNLKHDYVGTEHILLGLIAEGQGVAAKALESLGISLPGVRQKVEEAVGEGQDRSPTRIRFTPRTKKVLELSLREAHDLGHTYIGTEHILLGVIREGEGVAAQVLVSLGADLNRVRQAVVELLRAHQAELVSTEVSRSWISRSSGGVSSRLAEDALAQVRALATRVTAIERWVGMRADVDDLDQEIAIARLDKQAAIVRPDLEAAAALREKERELVAARAAREKEWTTAGAGRPSLARELSRVKSELDRLRELLREHGIELGDGPASSGEGSASSGEGSAPSGEGSASSGDRGEDHS